VNARFKDLSRSSSGPAAGRLSARFTGPLMVLGAVVVLGVVAVLGVLLLHSRTDQASGSGDENATVVSALEVPVGQCVNSAGLNDPNLVTVTTCAQPHDATVFARLELSPAETATDVTIRAAADKLCQAAIPAGAGTDVQLSFYFPTAEDAADNADHRLTCVFDNSGDASPTS